MKQKCWGCL